MKTNYHSAHSARKRKQDYVVEIVISCTCADEKQKVQAAVLYHLEVLEPAIEVSALFVKVTVTPIDPKLFAPDEACEIIRQTLAQSLTFVQEWTCSLKECNRIMGQ